MTNVHYRKRRRKRYEKLYDSMANLHTHKFCGSYCRGSMHHDYGVAVVMVQHDYI